LIKLQECVDRWTGGGRSSNSSSLSAHAPTSDRRSHPRRQLTQPEIEFLKSRMSSRPLKKDIVAFEHFKKFAKWWSPTLTTLIALSSEWQCVTPVLLHGFIGRQRAEQLLNNESEGAFVVRFSESRPGWLAISFNEKRRSEVTGRTEMKVSWGRAKQHASERAKQHASERSSMRARRALRRASEASMKKSERSEYEEGQAKRARRRAGEANTKKGERSEH
jgi:hypothetical protein